ncbi:MAG: glutamine--fructose-6-phosphate transaminase (isomerizing) [bacterium]|nr:glutamine--fructose-6-phosphate transaminase (isomerizing) [bacterium]
MCGIVGILGTQPVADDLVDALKRLEYRGYDSAGISTVENGVLGRLRAKGKLKKLQKRLNEAPLKGYAGIGHTRWATHGAPNETNAHPHMTDKVAVVHNGIIENFKALRDELEREGACFESDTDTEVIVHLISEELAMGRAPEQAVHGVLTRLEGAFAIAVIFGGYDDLMIGARRGSPLAIGYGKDQMYLGSDAIALAPFTDRVSYMEDGDWVILTRSSATILDEAGQEVERKITKSFASAMLVDKGNHRHFMAKEIHQQPEVIAHTLGHYVDLSKNIVKIPDFDIDFNTLPRITISACGTAYYAGLVAKYWFERYARLPIEIDVASEMRYREAPMEPGGLALFISQSGETADTLATLRYSREQKQHVASVVNVKESTIARESDAILPTLAGPEIGVASTKAFTCQLTVLACLAIKAGRERGHISKDEEKDLVTQLVELPRHISSILKNEHLFEKIAQNLAHKRDVLYLGRGSSFPIALEGALKLKEISYIHAEGYAAGELKHGPIALIDEDVPVVVVAPKDDLFEKTVSNMEEVAARGGQIILLTDDKDAADAFSTASSFVVPKAHSFTNPLLFAVPVQLLAYHTAVFMGTDVDQPRNLAKSVTVE